ncbi:MAG: F0F1 ATP synthase subunit delta [Oscillatoriales cyanobacterium]|jgi:F-type H+-transporting ATPase subunit delta|nr:MAG: F0F1 ATP synthase subunit delta [Oscillatoriales cyanobacterium]
MQSGVSASIVAPYAEALMSIAKAHNVVDAIGDDVQSLRQMLSESSDFAQFLANPLVGAQTKKGVLSQVTRDGFNAYTKNFLMLLVDRSRVFLLDAICEQYQSLLRDLKGIVLAEVTSASELSHDQVEAVREKVKSFTGANGVDISLSTDADLIGGVTIKVGSQVLDASLRGQLRRLALSLS